MIKSRVKAFFDPQVMLVASILAVLVALAFPPVGLWPLAWISFIAWAVLFARFPYLRLRAPIFFFWYSFGVHLFGFYWVAYLFHEFASVSWFVAVLILFVAMAAISVVSFLFGRFYLWLQRQICARWGGGEFSFVALAIVFVAWDFLDLRLYPWTPVMSVGQWEILLSSAGILGTNGWRLLFFLSAPLIAFLALRPVSRRERILNVLSATIVIWAIPILAGFWNRKTLMEEYKFSRPVAILQGNIGNSYKKNAKLGEIPSVRKIAAIYRDLIEEASIHFFSEEDLTAEQEPIYFWPETSFPSIWNQDDFLALELRSWVEKSKGLHLVGAYENGDIQLGMDDEIKKTVDFNVLAALGGGRVEESYRKNIRMPFGEYIPGDHWFPQAYKWLPSVNHFGPGSGFALLNTKGKGPIFVPLICYEILFDSFVNAFVRKGHTEYPDRDLVLVNPSNDSWYGPTSEPFQNEFLARWHAARLRLPMVRPANTGMSVVIAPWGEVLSEGHLDEPEVVYGELPLKYN